MALTRIKTDQIAAGAITGEAFHENIDLSGKVIDNLASIGTLTVHGHSGGVGQVQLNCSENTHGQLIASQPHSQAASNTLTLPGGTIIGDANAVLVSDTGIQTLTNKTISNGILTGTLNAGGNTGANGQVLASTGSGIQWVTSETSSGTVTSVSLSGGTTGLTVSGGPITTSGTITLSGTLAVANGGTGVTTSTGTGSVVRSISPTFAGTSVFNNISVNGDSLTSTAATFNLVNTNTTTLNIGAAATALNLGSSAEGATATFAKNVTIIGNLTVQGTTTTEASASLSVSDSVVNLNEGATTNSRDIGLIGEYKPSTVTLYTGFVKDATDGVWKMFSDITNKPSVGTTVDFTGATFDPLRIGALTATNGTFTSALTYGGVTLSNAVTGTGNMVLSSSPTLVSPALGTPSSGSLVNCTFPILNQNTSGSAGSLSDTSNFLIGRGTYAAANIDTTTALGVWNQNNVGDSDTVLVFGQGGSTSTVQMRFKYTGTMQFRNRTDSVNWNAFKSVLTSANYTSYAPTLTGGGASGTWGINVTGNAASITNQANSATITASTAATANQIVLRNGEGDDFRRYGFAQYFNMSHGVSGATGDTVFYSSNDDYIRKNNATGFRASLNAVFARTQGNWLNSGVIDNVVGLLAWKNYGNVHVIFDASQGTSPSGTAVNRTNSQDAWQASYPTLMGWNGSTTYGVRVDSARVADSATDATKLPLSGGTMVGLLATTVNTAGFNGANDTTISVRGTTAAGAIMSFHRPGAYAVNFGLDNDNIMKIGGWSAGGIHHQWDMAGNAYAFGSIRSPIFYDSNNTGYYCDPHNASRFYSLTMGVGALYSDIYMLDDEAAFGQNRIHANSGIIGFLRGDGGLWFLYCNASGSFSPAFNATSDYRLKRDVRPFVGNALNIIDQLEEVEYELIQNNTQHIGYIAHQVKEIYPTVVIGEKDATRKDGSIDPQAIDYGRMVPLMASGIKQLRKELQELKTEIALLKQNIN